MALTKALLALFTILTLSFAALAAYEAESPSRTKTATTTIAVTIPSATAVAQNNHEVILMSLSGSYYWADDVSMDTVIGLPGLSYFLNGSITFDGVKFQTICPATYRDCPGSNSSSAIVAAGDMQFNMTFPDKTTETAGNVIGDSIYTLILSQHSPRAGMLIEYVNDYPNNTADYGVFLLVSSCGGPPHLC